MRVHALLSRAITAIAAALFLCACGSTTHHRAAPVKLSLSAPPDGARIDASTATISGAVSPRTARVLVFGRAVKPNADGNFSAVISLNPGTNLVDVIASAPNARPAMTTVRVTRYVLVSVPNVTGQSPNAGAAQIRDAGLKAQLHGSSDPFDFLIPVSSQVCSQSPQGGAHVQPDSTVTLQIGKVC